MTKYKSMQKLVDKISTKQWKMAQSVLSLVIVSSVAYVWISGDYIDAMFLAIPALYVFHRFSKFLAKYEVL